MVVETANPIRGGPGRPSGCVTSLLCDNRGQGGVALSPCGGDRDRRQHPGSKSMGDYRSVGTASSARTKQRMNPISKRMIGRDMRGAAAAASALALHIQMITPRRPDGFGAGRGDRVRQAASMLHCPIWYSLASRFPARPDLSRRAARTRPGSTRPDGDNRFPAFRASHNTDRMCVRRQMLVQQGRPAFAEGMDITPVHEAQQNRIKVEPFVSGDTHGAPGRSL